MIKTAIDEGLPVIHLQKEPIGRYWKPERRRFEACARGNLLVLSPWGLDKELMRETALKSAGTTAERETALKSAGPMAERETALKSAGTMAVGTTAAAHPSDYARFHRLNDLAAEICNTTDAFLLNFSDICGS